jgi:hypothetical protein
MSHRQPKGPVRAASILRSTLKRLGLHAGLSRQRVVHAWPKIVEATVARHARAERLTGSTLHVIVDSSVWMSELAAVKTLLLEKVNAYIASDASPITDIRFSQRSWGKPLPREPERLPLPEPTGADTKVVNQLLEPVKDEEVRAVLKRILEKDRVLKRRRSGSSD